MTDKILKICLVIMFLMVFVTFINPLLSFAIAFITTIVVLGIIVYNLINLD